MSWLKLSTAIKIIATKFTNHLLIDRIISILN